MVFQGFVIFVSDDGNFASHCDAKVVNIEMADESGSEGFQRGQYLWLASNDVVFVDLEYSRIKQFVPDGDIPRRNGIEQHLRVAPELGRERGRYFLRRIPSTCGANRVAQREECHGEKC